MTTEFSPAVCAAAYACRTAFMSTTVSLDIALGSEDMLQAALRQAGIMAADEDIDDVLIDPPVEGQSAPTITVITTFEREPFVIPCTPNVIV